MTSAPPLPPLPGGIRPAGVSPSGSSVSGAPSGGSAGGVKPIDPVRLVRQYWLLVAIAAGIGVVVGVGVQLVLSRVKPTYTSMVTYLISPAVADTTFRPERENRDEFERFTNTEARLMVSERILMSVLTDPEIRGTSWASRFQRGGSFRMDEALKKLEDSISAAPMPRTDFIRLNMRSSTPGDALIIVSKVDQAYRSDLQQRSAAQTTGRRESLTREISDLTAEIESRERLRTQLMDENDIQSLDGRLETEAREIVSLQDRITDLTGMRAMLEQQLSDWARRGDAMAVQAYDETIRAEAEREPTVTTLKQQIVAIETDIESLRLNGLGEQHPYIMARMSNLEGTRKKLADEREQAYANLFAARVDNVRAQIQQIAASVSQHELSLQAATTRRQDLTRIHRQIEDLNTEIMNRRDRREYLRGIIGDMQTIQRTPAAARVAVVQSARLPSRPSFPPSLPIMGLLGMFAFAGLTAGLVVLREIVDQRVRGPGDLSLVDRLKILGMIPDAGQVPERVSNVATSFREAPQGVLAEAFRQMRTSLVRAMERNGHKTLVVLSGMPGSGATSLVTNLGLCCATAGDRTLVIDANLRRPGVHSALGLGEQPGLADVLAGVASLDQAVQQFGGVSNLYVLTAGSVEQRTMSERLVGPAMDALLAEAKERFDRVIVDAPPAIVSADGLALANKCDSSMLVVRAMREKRGLVNRVRNQLVDCRGAFLGAVANAVRSSAGGYFKRNIRATHQYRRSA